MFIVLAGAAALWGFYHFFGPISTVVDTPLMREYSSIHKICAKLRWYSDGHSTFPNGVTTNSSIDGLVAVGILSADDAAYIRDHQIEYHGFDLRHIAADVPVFETVFTNTSSPRHIFGFSDGSATMRGPNTSP
jgi:hypothetical protein